jgi:hypothetical protein
MRLSCFYTLFLYLIFNFAFSQKDTTQITQKYKYINYTVYYFHNQKIDITKVDTINLINFSSRENSIIFLKENNFTHLFYFSFYNKYSFFYLKKGFFINYFSSEFYKKYYNEIAYNTVNKVKLEKVEYKTISTGLHLYLGKSWNRLNLELGSDLFLTDVLTFLEASYSDGKINKDIVPFTLKIELYPQLSIHYLLIKSKNIYINTSIMYNGYLNYNYIINSFRYGIGLTKQF